VIRLTWLAVAGLKLVVFVLGLSYFYEGLQQVCAERYDACWQQGGLLSFEAQNLADEGWSLPAFAGVNAIDQVVVLALTAGTGALIFWRRPVDRLGLIASLFLVIGVETSLSDALVAVQPGWWLPTRVLHYVGAVCMTSFFYVFPSGQFVPGWSRWLAGLWALVFFFPSLLPASPLNINNWPGPLVIAFVVPLFGSLILAQVYRYRAIASAVERLQTKWVVFATALAFLATIATFVYVINVIGPAGARYDRFWLLVGLGFQLPSILIPLAIGVAIARYRLFDIDVIIRRTLIYSVLTVLLALAYFGSVLVLESLFRAFTGQGQNSLVVVLSTLAIAALFGPLRARVQRAIDRRFFRRKYDAARTLAGFAASARDETDLALLSERLVRTVAETMQPASVGLWLRPHDKRSPQASRSAE
jgi:hypothetical protein